jgi:predicted transcriptional regulator
MDEQTAPTSEANLLELTSDIVASFVSNNTVGVTELLAFIRQVHTALTAASNAKAEAEQVKLEPAVPIKSSVKADYIICLEDGKKFKSLKRHLRTAFNMTPEEYRKKWGLKHDYPMVASAYAAKRSELAKSIGLGNLRAKAVKSAPKAVRGKKGGQKRAAA